MARRPIQTALATTLGLGLSLALLLSSTGQPASAVVPSAGMVPAVTVVANGSLSFSPVTYTKGGSITANFTGSAVVKNRPVVLNYLRGSTWVKVGSKGKMDSKGKSVFKVAPTEGLSYQAVAASYKYKAKGKKKTAPEVATSPGSVGQDWSRTFTDYFSSGFDSRWADTFNNNYDAEGRWCSAPRDENSRVSGGNAELKMSQVTSASEIAQVNATARAKQTAARNAAIAAARSNSARKAAKAMKIDGCPKGVFKNVRMSTEGSSGFHMKTGIVAAEVTFPKYQGFHGGIWLQSMGGSELDIIEAFGYRKGIQNVVHVKKTEVQVGEYDTPESQKWVAKSAVKKSSWWKKSHVFSIEWTRTNIIFRLDGSVTKTVDVRKTSAKTLPDTDYFLVMSILSSDWETGRLTKPVNGGTKAPKGTTKGTMKVNWVKAWAKA